jgi:hypothetical protein
VVDEATLAGAALLKVQGSSVELFTTSLAIFSNSSPLSLLIIFFILVFDFPAHSLIFPYFFKILITFFGFKAKLHSKIGIPIHG